MGSGTTTFFLEPATAHTHLPYLPIFRAYKPQDDNDDSSLPLSYRRWWHFEVNGLLAANPENCTSLNLRVNLLNSCSWTEHQTITPVWQPASMSYAYTRVAGGPPVFTESTWRFDLSVDASVDAIFIAKFYPMTPPRFQALRDSVLADPHSRETVIGTTNGGGGMPPAFPLYRWDLDILGDVADTSVPTIFITSGVHPAELTSYFVVEGLVDWLLHNPAAERLRRLARVIILPSMNPTGLHHGNYRVTTGGVNLENEYAAPYDTSVVESRAIQDLVEELMASSSPIQLYLNLHSTHNCTTGCDFPFHYVHEPFYYVDGRGVSPAVRDLEETWVDIFKSKSEFVGKGESRFSTFATRQYVESFIHDQYSENPSYTGPGVMAITFEGTYEVGLHEQEFSSPALYQTVGGEMGEALLEYVSQLPECFGGQLVSCIELCHIPGEDNQGGAEMCEQNCIVQCPSSSASGLNGGSVAGISVAVACFALLGVFLYH